MYTANIAAIANPTAGGSIRNLGCYPISLVRLLAGAEPVEITAIGRINVDNQNDNQASAILKFENNVMAVVTTADDMEMYSQFDIYGTNGCLKVLTNPWLPDCVSNKIIIHHHDKAHSVEIDVTAQQSLYTYQIDAMCKKIFSANYLPAHEKKNWQDTLGNVITLDKWFQQVTMPIALNASC